MDRVSNKQALVATTKLEEYTSWCYAANMANGALLAMQWACHNRRGHMDVGVLLALQWVCHDTHVQNMC